MLCKSHFHPNEPNGPKRFSSEAPALLLTHYKCTLTLVRKAGKGNTRSARQGQSFRSSSSFLFHLIEWRIISMGIKVRFISSILHSQSKTSQSHTFVSPSIKHFSCFFFYSFCDLGFNEVASRQCSQVHEGAEIRELFRPKDSNRRQHEHLSVPRQYNLFSLCADRLHF